MLVHVLDPESSIVLMMSAGRVLVAVADIAPPARSILPVPVAPTKMMMPRLVIASDLITDGRLSS